MEIIRDTKNTVFDGCDFVVKVEKNRRFRLLQLTDMQVIDSLQARRPDRLRADEIAAWLPENFDSMCGDHIRTLVAQARPDLIFITGDIIYGSFDDSGSTFDWFCRLMDSFRIPWAPVFGNHDNEAKIGVTWQCERFESSEYCLFKRGAVSGNGNYTVGLAVGDKLVRVIHMLDSNGCSHSDDESVVKSKGIYADQLELVRSNTAKITAAQGEAVDAFAAFHIPVDLFIEAEKAKGYCTDDDLFYTIGVDVPAVDGDFGCKYEDTRKCIPAGDAFLEFLRDCNINGIFVGHDHQVNTCITYKGIKWVYGLKTGQYDYHNPAQTGGTLITVDGKELEICHIPSLSIYGAYPSKAPMFKGFFTEA